MKKLALLVGVAAALCLGRPAYAQGVFADVPQGHWAYDAVNELAARGIFTGYPDQTFGGKRALTRYEFAVAIQRMLQDIQHKIDAIPKPGTPTAPGTVDTSNLATKAEVQELRDRTARLEEEQRRLRGDVDTLQRLLNEFRDALEALGADVDQLKRDVAALANRLGKVEETIAKMPKITGSASLAFIGTRLEHPELFAAGPAPTDIDGRPLGGHDNILQSIRAIYDVDLGITARLSDVATAHVLLNAGNYLKGYLNNSLSTVREVNDQAQSFDQVTAYYAYLDTPISFGSFGSSITVGKFGQQFTPYTLKLVDVDSYTYNDKTDGGNYPIVGGRINFKLGGVNVQYYAGKHDIIPYAPLTSTAGVSNAVTGSVGPPDFSLRGPLFVGNVPGVLLPPTPDTNTLDQSQGARISFGVPMHGTLGVTWLEAAGSRDADRYRQLQVYGADLNATIFGALRLSAEFAQSRWKNRTGQETTGVSAKDREIIDARLGYRFGRIDLLGYYKWLGIGYDAPGYWGSIGRWKNPRDLEGYGGILTVPLGSRTAFDAEAARYRFIGAGDNHLNHYRAGVRFALTSSNRVDLGWESAEYKPAGGDKAREQYINLGFGHNFSPTTSFKLLYQIIRFRVGSTTINPGQDYDGDVAATQFTVRF